VHGSWFGYRWDVYECWSVLAIGVTPMSLWPLITVGNLGASSCLDANFYKLNCIVKPFLL
jgi:hypothetical protein